MAVSAEEIRKSEVVLVKLSPFAKGTKENLAKDAVAAFEYEANRYEIGFNGALGVEKGVKIDNLPISRGAYEHLLFMRKQFWPSSNPFEFTMEESKYQPKSSKTFTQDEVKAMMDKKDEEMKTALAANGKGKK